VWCLPSFLVECRTCKRQKNQGGNLCLWYLVVVVVVDLCSESHRLRNDLYCVEWGVKLYSLICVVNHAVPLMRYLGLLSCVIPVLFSFVSISHVIEITLTVLGGTLSSIQHQPLICTTYFHRHDVAGFLQVPLHPN